ncbi:MAG TPA: hypothetical protein VFV33_05680, partial [Gemmatimonadaceae bacterium]|nr:hypothetical protein [Gemmatimonadaceae bacterium]
MVPADEQAAPSAAPPSAPPAKPGFARRHWGKLTLLALVGLPLAGMGIWSAAALSYSYSTGTRTGYVQKLSRKGWLCKTWEGELAMATAPGVSPQIFTFTIRDDSLARALTQDMGRGRVAVEYKEHRGVPTSCFGDTPYFVDTYRMVEGAT